MTDTQQLDQISKQAINQQHISIDPKKLIIYCSRISSKMDEDIPVMFSLHNVNLQDVSEFDIEPEYDYPLNKSNIKWNKYVAGQSANDLSVGLIGGNYLKYQKGNLKIGMTITSEYDGELYIRTNFANLSHKGGDYQSSSKSIPFNSGTNQISFILDDYDFNPLNVVCFGASVKCHISKCYIYIDPTIDHYIEPKSQDIVLDHYFTDQGQYIKHNGTNWVDQDGNVLSEHDQQQLNSIDASGELTNIVSIGVLSGTYLSFELVN